MRKSILSLLAAVVLLLAALLQGTLAQAGVPRFNPVDQDLPNCSATITQNCNPGNVIIPQDGRLNRDPTAAAVVYCKTTFLEVWAVDSDGVGHLAFTVPYTQITALGTPRLNTLIASGLGVRLYKLSSGELQINAIPRVPPYLFSSSARASTIATPVPAPTTTYTYTVVSVSGNTIIHVVQKGENLFRISLRYHVSMAAIAAANGITNFNLIYAGQRLIIPAAGTVVTTSNAVNTNPVVSTSSILSATTAGAAVVVPPTAIPTQPEYVFTWGGC